jgi:uncharacterized protein (DUF983 family)
MQKRMPPAPVSPARRRRVTPALVFARALVLHCPRCGHGKLFHRWFTMVKRCPGCSYLFEREEGFALGASVVNLMFGQVVAVAFLVVSLVLTSPDPPILRLVVLGVIVALGTGVLFLPFSKTIWSGIDLVMHATMGASYASQNVQPGLRPEEIESDAAGKAPSGPPVREKNRGR